MGDGRWALGGCALDAGCPNLSALRSSRPSTTSAMYVATLARVCARGYVRSIGRHAAARASAVRPSPNAHRPSPMQCPACRAEMPAGMKFCGNCGAALPQESSDSSAERRQLTVVFVDLVGSTALSESLDPEELRDLYTNYQSECARIIRRYDGHVAQYLGDGILAYFGYPIAREDNAARAVHSGLEILEAMSKVDVNGQRPHVRVGIHTGLVVVGDVGSGEKREQLALGETPNIAARIQGEAQPDTVFVSEPTRRLISGHFKVEDLGERALKGITKPMRVFRVIRANDSTTRFAAVSAGGMAPFVGREHELESVRSRWQQSKNGAGQTLILRAEAGMGKSRLAGAAKEFAATGPHELFEAQCSPYHAGSALYPIVDMLARRLLFESAGSPEAKLA